MTTSGRAASAASGLTAAPMYFGSENAPQFRASTAGGGDNGNEGGGNLGGDGSGRLEASTPREQAFSAGAPDQGRTQSGFERGFTPRAFTPRAKSSLPRVRRNVRNEFGFSNDRQGHGGGGGQKRRGERRSGTVSPTSELRSSYPFFNIVRRPVTAADTVSTSQKPLPPNQPRLASTTKGSSRQSDHADKRGRPLSFRASRAVEPAPQDFKSSSLFTALRVTEIASDVRLFDGLDAKRVPEPDLDRVPYICELLDTWATQHGGSVLRLKEEIFALIFEDYATKVASVPIEQRTRNVYSSAGPYFTALGAARAESAALKAKIMRQKTQIAEYQVKLEFANVAHGSGVNIPPGFELVAIPQHESSDDDDPIDIDDNDVSGVASPMPTDSTRGRSKTFITASGSPIRGTSALRPPVTKRMRKREIAREKLHEWLLSLMSTAEGQDDNTTTAGETTTGLTGGTSSGYGGGDGGDTVDGGASSARRGGGGGEPSRKRDPNWKAGEFLRFRPGNALNVKLPPQDEDNPMTNEEMMAMVLAEETKEALTVAKKRLQRKPAGTAEEIAHRGHEVGESVNRAFRRLDALLAMEVVNVENFEPLPSPKADPTGIDELLAIHKESKEKMREKYRRRIDALRGDLVKTRLDAEQKVRDFVEASEIESVKRTAELTADIKGLHDELSAQRAHCRNHHVARPRLYDKGGSGPVEGDATESFLSAMDALRWQFAQVQGQGPSIKSKLKKSVGGPGAATKMAGSAEDLAAAATSPGRKAAPTALELEAVVEEERRVRTDMTSQLSQVLVVAESMRRTHDKELGRLMEGMRSAFETKLLRAEWEERQRGLYDTARQRQFDRDKRSALQHKIARLQHGIGLYDGDDGDEKNSDDDDDDDGDAAPTTANGHGVKGSDVSAEGVVPATDNNDDNSDDNNDAHDETNRNEQEDSVDGDGDDGAAADGSQVIREIDDDFGVDIDAVVESDGEDSDV